MVAWRPAKRVGDPGALADQVGGGHRGVGRGPDRLPASRPDQGHRVVAEPANPPVHGGRRAHRLPGEQPCGREDVGNHPGPAVLAGVAGGLPVGPDGGQVLDQLGVVHREQGLVAVRPGVGDHGAGLSQRAEQYLGALRHLGPGLPDAEPDLAVRLVPQAVLAPHDRQARDAPGCHHVLLALRRASPCSPGCGRPPRCRWPVGAMGRPASRTGPGHPPASVAGRPTARADRPRGPTSFARARWAMIVG